MWQKTVILKKKSENLLGSGVFGMGRSIYLKHEYFFSRPKWLDQNSDWTMCHTAGDECRPRGSRNIISSMFVTANCNSRVKSIMSCHWQVLHGAEQSSHSLCQGPVPGGLSYQNTQFQSTIIPKICHSIYKIQISFYNILANFDFTCYTTLSITDIQISMKAIYQNTHFVG